MVISKDTITLDADFPFHINEVLLKKTDNCEDSFHWHKFCEITYVQGGNGYYFVNGIQYEMKQGDLIIFNNIEPHGWMVQDEDMQVLVMIFLTDFVSEFHSDYLKPFIERGSNFKNKVHSEDALALVIASGMDEILKEYNQKIQGYQLLIKADVLRILTFLIRYYQNAVQTSSNMEDLNEKKNAMGRLEEAFRYINVHYTEKITLGEVAQSVYMSDNYFSTYFKKVTNCSFIDYITELRLKKVNELMKVTDLNMLDIAMECGFNNMSNFYRMYKKHIGELPERKSCSVKH